MIEINKQANSNITNNALKDSEMRYRRLFETAQDGILILNGTTGEIIDANPFTLKILGYTYEELIGKQLCNFVFFKDIDASRMAIKELEQNDYTRYEYLPLKTKEGRCIEVEFICNVYLVDDMQMMQCNIRNNSKLKKAEERITFQASLLKQVGEAIIVTDQNGFITYINKTAEELYGWSDIEAIGLNILDDTQNHTTQAQVIEIMKSLTNGESCTGDIIVQRRDGTNFPVHITNSPILDPKGNIIGLISISFDITKRKQAEDIFVILLSVVEQTSDIVFITDQNGIIEFINPAFEQLTGFSKEEAIGMTPRILKSGLHSNKEYEELWATILDGKVLHGEIINRKKNGELFYEEKTITPILNDQGNITHFVKTSHNITSLKQRERELEAINIVSMALRVTKNLHEMVYIILNEIMGVMHATQGAIWLFDPCEERLRRVANLGGDEAVGNLTGQVELGEEINSLVFETGEPFVSSDIYHDIRLSDAIRHGAISGMGGAIIPIFVGESVIGTFNINVLLPREIKVIDVRLLTTLSEIAASAIHRSQLYEKTQRDTQRLAALHSIDVSINASDDMNSTLNIILDHVVDLLNVSAADILLYNPFTLTLDYSAGKGFRFSNIEKSHMNLGEGYAGYAALKRITVNAPDLRIVGTEYARKELLEKEEFIAYYGVPLITKGKIIGVLDIFHRSHLTPDSEWLDFMEVLANQAAIAIDKSNLFDDLQQSNIELLQAYNKTIEGWSRAMDLRDHETEGHTQRVTELTVRLARTLGLREEEIVHVRRGALLHDMGKVGIPDSILLKPGPLTEDEWIIMRQHPRYVFDMLSPIKFLKSALDIPYCHHEKWDGTGYPRGLKKEQIPIAARLFAIVDVWDALSSDRPYRKAWCEEKVIEHIKSLSGKHFDPEVVDLFLKIV